MPEDRLGRLARLRSLWVRHRTLFWTLHSLWALATGFVVIFLARERYGFVPWVVLFLVLTWISTRFFGGSIVAGAKPEGEGAVPQGRAPGPAEVVVPGVGQEATAYLTRTMYQETLFFLLPFYWYSTVFGSLNVLFLCFLAGLAVFSCLDLVFDRWIRTRPLFGLIFFATVAFSALNLLVPILVPVDPAMATPLAAGAAVVSAVPLALQGSLASRALRVRIAVAGLVLLGVPIALPRFIPPVPLRAQSTVFSTDIDRTSLVPADTLGARVRAEELQGSIYLLVEVFAPSIVPITVVLEWRRDGQVIRTSREVEITAHDLGFRVWDGWRPEGGQVAPGRYDVILRTGGERVFGRAEIVVEGE